MSVCFDEPDRVLLGRILVAGHLLLIETPFWQFDFMAEQVAACQDVSQSELCPECP